ncbi:Alpha/Beta hydrolase protein [Favolaschia claudopus]|uniref:Alpha/Beta hydrolase protein n=1 Tax=Favolaschia claudopus TaxID=2862362 RepID=A0AAW0B103_9AGAR
MARKKATTPVLEIAYYEHGPGNWLARHTCPRLPYDIHLYDDVVPLLVAQGARVILPYVRGYGPTRFLSPSTMRTGQQAALASDLIELMNALNIEKAVLAGFDWGGLASCVASALWPERGRWAGFLRCAFRSLPSLECVMWYQHLFQGERGRDALQWSPTWAFSESLFEEVVKSFDNPDFVDVVLHCYRHVFGNAGGDPALEPLEERLAQKLKITVPTITLDGILDPLKPGGSASHAEMFTGRHELRVENVGHAFPAEAPAAFADAVLTVHRWSLE